MISGSAMHSGTPDTVNVSMAPAAAYGSTPARAVYPESEGDVDLDRGFTDYPSIIRNAGLNHLSGRPSRPEPDYVTYVLRPGDTLSEIAARFGTTVSELAGLNHISNPDQIYPGDTIRIPEKDAT